MENVWKNGDPQSFWDRGRAKGARPKGAFSGGYLPILRCNPRVGK